MGAMSTVILDTNTLILLIVGRASKAYISKHKRTDKFTKFDFDNLNLLLARYDAQTTLPHVLTEASNLLDFGHGIMREEIFSEFKKFVTQQTEMAEPSISGVRSIIFDRLGLTDAMLFELAKSGAVLVTTDWKLHQAAQGRGLESINFNQIIDQS
jgi:hypothetical protein